MKVTIIRPSGTLNEYTVPDCIFWFTLNEREDGSTRVIAQGDFSLSGKFICDFDESDMDLFLTPLVLSTCGGNDVTIDKSLNASKPTITLVASLMGV